MMKYIAILALVGFHQSSLVQSDFYIFSKYYTVEYEKSSCSIKYHEGEKTMNVLGTNTSDSLVTLNFQYLDQEDNLTNIVVDIIGSSKGFYVNIDGTADNNTANNNFTITSTGQSFKDNKETGLAAIYISTTNYKDNKNDSISACFDAAFNYNATDASTNNTLSFNVTTTELGCWNFTYINGSSTLAYQSNQTTTNNMTSWAQSLGKDICNGAINIQFSLLAIILTAIVSLMNK